MAIVGKDEKAQVSQKTPAVALLTSPMASHFMLVQMVIEMSVAAAITVDALALAKQQLRHQAGATAMLLPKLDETVGHTMVLILPDERVLLNILSS
jgi:hypothetical protein